VILQNAEPAVAVAVQIMQELVAQEVQVVHWAVVVVVVGQVIAHQMVAQVESVVVEK
jgi:hypothetical protein